MSFSIRFGTFIIFLLYFLLNGADVNLTASVLLLPVLLIVMAGIGLGLGIIVSSLTTKYRDLQHLLGFGLQLLMYASPVIYSISAVPTQWRWLLLVNPLTAVIETFRGAFLGGSSLEPVYLLYSTGFMFAVLLIGVFIFNRVESTFMDTV